MPKRSKPRASLDEILRSLSEDFFPDAHGSEPVTIDSRRADGDTPLHILAHARNSYAVQLLIEAGADVNAVGDMSETPLHIALRKKDLASANALVAAGANSHLVSEFGQSCFDIAKDLGGAFKRLLHDRHVD